jgi:hypothetical protein
MWWPAIGGVVIGLGGWIEPRALGVGFESIAALLNDQLTVRAILLLVAVKWVIWSCALGSGTSGGVLAPLLMIGGAVGALEGHVLPGEGAGFWALISMGAILGGTMRSPLTGILFAAEITGDFGAMLPLTVACVVAHGFTVLVLRRSILTEKVARRGYHVSREYEIDPLEVLFVRDVMELPPAAPAPITPPGPDRRVHPDDTLRTVAYRMATAEVVTLPILGDDHELIGDITLADVLKARRRHLEEETRRERVLPMHRLIPAFLRPRGEAPG